MRHINRRCSAKIDTLVCCIMCFVIYCKLTHVNIWLTFNKKK